MGMISIELGGSFPHGSKRISALRHGHAQAVAEAIRYLVTVVLPVAIERDHELQSEGHVPEDGKFKPFVPGEA